MKSLVSGIDVTLDGETHTLKPSLKAATTISRQFGGFMGAVQALAASDLNAYLVIARSGIAAKTISTDDLNEAVYSTGIQNLMEPFLRYVRILQNGGREPVEDEDHNGEEADEGNDVHV